MRQTQLFTKTIKQAPKDEPSLNAQLLIRAGFIDKLAAGIYSFLPLGLMVLNKIENIIREEMNAIGGQEILMPAIHPKENWEAAGRWEAMDVLYKIKDFSEREFALGATHEEIITPLAGKFISSYKDLPKYIYQFQTKFRDEKRAKSGLLRGKEFRMKDLYSFHQNQNDLDDYYEKAAEAYKKIFMRLGIGEITFLTFASGGAFSKYSHEFQTVSEIGEDTIYICEKCKVAVNKEIIGEQKTCPQCGNSDLTEKKSIETGNIFKLGDRFSKAFGLKYLDKNGKENCALMGCYGIGLSRIMGTLVEIFHDNKGIIWSEMVAPFRVHLIDICKGEKFSAGLNSENRADKIYCELQEAGVEVLFDDRDISAGAKFADADLIGIPYRVVVSEKTLSEDSVEIKRRDLEKIEMVKINKLTEKFKI
ncbi:MAG: aminoacyl--tRNA ligase-related protein [bacterium]